MEGKFYQAAITGDENLLYQLVDSISAEFVKETPLHIAAKYGHPNIVRKILSERPEFAFGLNSKGQTPLHLASAKGHLDAVKELLDENNNDQRWTALELLEENNNDQLEQRKLLDACFIPDRDGRSPLHIAAEYGHPDIVREILSKRPEFAFRLNSEGQTPLHLASAKGHLDSVKELLVLDVSNNDQRKLSDACFIRDKQGRSPLHLAAMNGHVEVLRWLVQTESSAAWVVTDGGQSSLHLCANNDHFKGVEELIGLVSEKVVFINLKDDADNNILHLLAAKRQYKMITRLVSDNEGVDINAMNRERDTVLDVALKNLSGIIDSLKMTWSEASIWAKTAKRMETSPGEPKKRTRRPPGDNFGKWLSEMRGNLLVVSILMATITFQATVSPPGGVWQDDLYFDNKTGNFITTPYVVPNGTGKWYSISTNESLTVIHKAGTPIMSDKDPFTSLFFTVSTTVGFAASVVVIVILAGGYSFQENVFMFWSMTWMAMIALSSMLLSYCCSIFLLSYRVVLMVPLAYAGIFTSAAFVRAYLQVSNNGPVSSKESKRLTQILTQIAKIVTLRT